MPIALLAALFALLIHAPASAQVSDEIVDATAGLWLVASEDGLPGCRLTFLKSKTIGGYALKEEKPCAGPLHDTVAAWAFGEGTIELRDATRKVMMSFEEQEGGPWRTPEGVTPRVYLIPEPGPRQSIPVASRLFETNWTLSDKKGKAPCGIKLSGRAIPDQDSYALDISKDCSASVKKTRISSWQISEINLVFIGGEDWSYTMLLMPDGNFVTDDGKYRLVQAKP
jgi:hypothetical protein